MNSMAASLRPGPGRQRDPSSATPSTGTSLIAHLTRGVGRRGLFEPSRPSDRGSATTPADALQLGTKSVRQRWPGRKGAVCRTRTLARTGLPSQRDRSSETASRRSARGCHEEAKHYVLRRSSTKGVSFTDESEEHNLSLVRQGRRTGGALLRRHLPEQR